MCSGRFFLKVTDLSHKSHGIVRWKHYDKDRWKKVNKNIGKMMEKGYMDKIKFIVSGVVFLAGGSVFCVLLVLLAILNIAASMVGGMADFLLTKMERR